MTTRQRITTLAGLLALAALPPSAAAANHTGAAAPTLEPATTTISGGWRPRAAHRPGGAYRGGSIAPNPKIHWGRHAA